MGLIASYLWENTGRTDDPDSDTGLTSRQKYIIRTTWKQISDGQNNLKTGMDIFINLFEKHPEYHQLFPFRDIPRSELKENSRFKAHCVSLMYALSSIIDNVDNAAMLVELLEKQAVNHVPRNVPDGAYSDLKEVLMEIFAKSLNDEELKTWNKFLDLGFGIMVKSATEYRNRQT